MPRAAFHGLFNQCGYDNDNFNRFSVPLFLNADTDQIGICRQALHPAVFVQDGIPGLVCPYACFIYFFYDSCYVLAGEPDGGGIFSVLAA